MFYLIGGAPRCGKTTVAKELSQKLGIPWISTDTLESTIMEYVDDSKFESYFPKSTLRKLTNNSNDEMYTKYTAEEIVDTYISQGASLAKGIKMFVASEAAYNHDYILEGHHIHPRLISELENQFEIKAIFLGRDDTSKTLAAITQNPKANDWVTTKTKDPQTYQPIAEMLTTFSTRIKSEASENNQLYLSMDDDFSETIQLIVRKLRRIDNFNSSPTG